MTITPPTAGQAPPGYGPFSALRQREFGLLWASGLGQAIGMGMQQIALGHFVFQRTASEFWVGAVAFMNFLPFFIFSLFAGAIGDRMDKRTLLIVAQALSGVATLALALLIVTDRVMIGHVLVVAAVSALGLALTVPVRLAYVHDLVDRGLLMNAIALNALAQNAMRLLGPIVAGLLIGWVGHGGAMFVNAACFAAGAAPLLLLRPRPPRRATVPVSVLGNVAEGLRFARATPAVLFILALSYLFSLFGMPYLAMLPVFAEKVLGVGPAGLGLLSAAAGAGSVVGAVALTRLGDVPYKGRLFAGFYVLFAAAVLLFALSPRFPLSLALLVLVGLGSLTHINVGTVMLQMRTPAGMQGRVMGLWTWGISLNYLGALPVGALAQVYGAPRVLAASAAIGLLGGLALIARARAADPAEAAEHARRTIAP
ncbi:MAG: MFS transporter [Dehalococcoidia bacterium]